MSRYDKTERIGVIETDRIVTNQLDWIFREQATVDVGIDAIIEQAINGEPTGKFIAVQIKTGIGNFHITENKIILYVSHIHYNYWLRVDFPIILIAHIPENNKTYWQHINEYNFKKTKKQWKIEIPKTQEFNLKAKEKLVQILAEKNQRNDSFQLFKGNDEEDNIFDFVENLECINDSKETLERISLNVGEIGTKATDFNIKVLAFISSGLTDKDEQVRASLKGFGRTLNIISKKIENELEIYSSLYSEGLFSYEQVIIAYFQITKDETNLITALEGINIIPPSVDIAIDGINDMKNTITKLPTKYSVLKESKFKLLEVVDLLISELIASKEIALNIIEKINLILSKPDIID